MTTSHRAQPPVATLTLPTPCDFITEARYEYALTAVDSRGKWAEALAELLGPSPKYEIKNDQVDVRSFDDKEALFIGVHHAGWQGQDVVSLEQVSEKTKRALLKELSLISSTPRPMARIGCRVRVGFPFPDSFEALRDRMLRTLAVPTPAFRGMFGSSIADIALVFNYESDSGLHSNISCGPMKDVQIASTFTRDSEFRFESAYLFADLDSYRICSQSEKLAPQAVVEMANELHATNFKKLIELRDVVFGG